MIGSRWKKLWGDIEQARGRILMMVVAIAVGVFAVASISTAYSILEREIGRDYLSTNPPAALLDVDHLDDEALAGVRALAGITGAEAGSRLIARVEVRPGEWLPLLLFVVPDFGAARIGTVNLEAGRWPHAAADIVLERTAVPLAGTAIEGKLRVQASDRAVNSLTVTGIVHDASLAPAWQEQTVYGYVTPATVALLGEDTALRVLKITVKNPGEDRLGLEHSVVAVADWLKRTGRPVHEIRIPPYRHPHAAIMSNVVRMLLFFSALTLALGALLTATLTASLLAPQVRQIAVMKAVGARRGQIMRLYAALIGGVAVLAVFLGLPLGVAAGQTLAQNTARMLNLDLSDRSAPAWLYAAQVLAGVGLPLLAAMLPIKTAAARTVRETLSDYGVRLSAAGSGPVVRWLSAMAPPGSAPLLALRNAFRRKGRLLLTLGLLAVAGAMFMTSLNVRAAWQRNLSDAAVERHFDAEFTFAHSQPESKALNALSAVRGVHIVEPWSAAAASIARMDGLRIVRTYPDGGHGSLQVQGVPRRSAFLSPALIDGRWLEDDGLDAAVLNEQAIAMMPGLRSGDRVRLAVRGVIADLHVIGIVREHLTQATVYVSTEQFAKITAAPSRTEGVRVGFERSEEGSAKDVIAQIERALELSDAEVAQSVSRAQMARALGGHLFILIFILEAMSILMAAVGIMGLGSAMAIGVLERTREFAVMRAIGAGACTIRLSVMAEAVLVAVLSAGVALPLSWPLTFAVERIVGVQAALSAVALPLWLAIAIVSAALSAAYPAWRASKLTIRKGLAYQ